MCSSDLGLLNDAFRRLHAAKGNFTMIGQDVQAEIAHQLETVLDYIRAKRRELSAECKRLQRVREELRAEITRLECE